MDKKDTALNCFKNGFNCAQSVLASYKDEFDIREEDLLKISCGLGGGMGRLQETCGAVTGAYLVIGLKFGKYKKEDDEAREKTYRLVREFDAEFKKLHDTAQCRELLNCSLLTEEGRKYFKENNLMERVCARCVEDAVTILEKLVSRHTA